MTDFLGQIRHVNGDGFFRAGIDGEHGQNDREQADANCQPGAHAVVAGFAAPFGVRGHFAQNQHEQDHDDGLDQKLRECQIRCAVQREDKGQSVAGNADDDDAR